MAAEFTSTPANNLQYYQQFNLLNVLNIESANFTSENSSQQFPYRSCRNIY